MISGQAVYAETLNSPAQTTEPQIQQEQAQSDKKVWQLTEAEKEAIARQARNEGDIASAGRGHIDTTSINCAMAARLNGNLMNFSEGPKHSFGLSANPGRIVSFTYQWGGNRQKSVTNECN